MVVAYFLIARILVAFAMLDMTNLFIRSVMSAQENLCGEDWKESQQVFTQLMTEYADTLRALKGHDSEFGLCVLTQWP